MKMHRKKVLPAQPYLSQYLELYLLLTQLFLRVLTDTFAILTPLLKVINPSFIIYYLKRWWKNRPWNRIELNQRALNKINE